MAALAPMWMRRLSTSVLVALATLALAPAHAYGQGPLPGPAPLHCDFKKAPVGSWARYTTRVTPGGTSLETRWAFLGRDATGNTIELTMEGSDPSLSKMGGKVVARMVLVPDPVGVSKPFRQLVMQLGNREPQEIPLDLPGLPGHKFQNPDPKKLVGRETIRVAAGSFVTSHYREVWEGSTVDAWLSDQVPPLGLVKTVVTPTPGTTGPGGKPMPGVTMELAAHGQGARPAITRAPRPFTPAPHGRN
jgi:hypothetical protein